MRGLAFQARWNFPEPCARMTAPEKRARKIRREHSGEKSG